MLHKFFVPSMKVIMILPLKVRYEVKLDMLSIKTRCIVLRGYLFMRSFVIVTSELVENLWCTSIMPIIL